MPVNNRIADFHDDLTAWRRDLHAHPELGFDEHDEIDAADSEATPSKVIGDLAQPRLVDPARACSCEGIEVLANESMLLDQHFGVAQVPPDILIHYARGVDRDACEERKGEQEKKDVGKAAAETPGLWPLHRCGVRRCGGGKNSRME